MLKREMFKYFWLIILVFVSFFPAMAYADAGTPLILLTFGHLLIGNAVIGVLEGLIIAKVFKAKYIKSIFIMVLANYISMIIGALGIGLSGAALKNFISINNLFYFIWGFLISSYLATIIIEWFFCFWIMKGKDNRKNLSFKASILVQSISYAVLIPIYFSVSGISLMTQTKVDKPSSFLANKNAWVYFISPNYDAVYKIKADGSSKQKIKDVVLNKKSTLLISDENGKVGLIAQWKLNEYYKNFIIHENYSKLFIENLSGVDFRVQDKSRPINIASIDFRPQDKRDWLVYTGTWAIQGLNGENKKTGQSLWLALETPFLIWSIKQITMLPNDQIVCQIGDNQIVLLDLNTRHLGLITFGKSPVVVIEK